MSDFTITEVGGKEVFSNDHGEFAVYEVDFTGDQGTGHAIHKRKSSSPAPVPGEVIDAEIVHKNGKVELKRVWKQNGSGGGGGFTGAGKSPEQQRSIVRQHSQDMAIRHCQILHLRGELGDVYNVEKLKPIIDWFVRDAEGLT